MKFNPARLRKVRERAGWSQTKLGEVMGGVNRQAICEYEAGRRVPPVKRITLLCDATKHTFGYFHGGW